MKRSGSRSKAAPAKKPDADYHRKMANTYSAKARIHGAKAELMDAQDPKKKPRYPY